nr:importin subunit alpha-3-like [Cherax quadricarinatus]XP_053638562.1 importin subunit alpha-3-like [Cherax quadricarinatus]
MSRPLAMITLTPALEKRFSKERNKPLKIQPENISLKSIRERRERLEAMIQSRRLPLIAPSPGSTPSSSPGSTPASSHTNDKPSRMSLSPHWKEKEKLERHPTNQQPNTSSVRLSPLQTHKNSINRLPMIKKLQPQQQQKQQQQKQQQQQQQKQQQQKKQQQPMRQDTHIQQRRQQLQEKQQQRHEQRQQQQQQLEQKKQQHQQQKQQQHELKQLQQQQRQQKIQQLKEDKEGQLSSPATIEHLNQMHKQMTMEIHLLMQQQMQQMQQLLQQKKEHQLRKQQKQEHLEQQRIQQRMQEAMEETLKKPAQEDHDEKEEQEATITPQKKHSPPPHVEEPTLRPQDRQPPDTTDNPQDVEARESLPADDGKVKEENEEAVGEEEAGEEEVEEEEDDISDEVDDIVEGIRSGDRRRQLANTEKARVLLSSDKPPISQFINAGILPPLVECMGKSENPELQVEAAWAVTNIASGPSQYTRALVDAGAVGVLVRLLSSPDVAVKEQAVWALGNIVGDGAEYRDRALKEGIVRPLVNLLHTTMPLALRRQVCWVITNLFRVKNPAISLEDRKECARALKEMVAHLDTQVQADALWGVAYYADMGPKAVDELVECGLVRDMVQRLYSDQEKVVIAALRATGSVAAGTNEQTDAVVQAGALPIYREMLNNPNLGVSREAAWILSNITAGTTRHIQLVIDVQVVPALIAAVEKDDEELRKEATWALSNLTSGCTTEQAAVLVNTGVMASFCRVMAGDDPGMVLVALDAVNNIFKKTEKVDTLVRIMESYSGLNTLSSLQNHQEAQISKMAKYLLQTYFQKSG